MKGSYWFDPLIIWLYKIDWSSRKIWMALISQYSDINWYTAIQSIDKNKEKIQSINQDKMNIFLLCNLQSENMKKNINDAADRVVNPSRCRRWKAHTFVWLRIRILWWKAKENKSFNQERKILSMMLLTG